MMSIPFPAGGSLYYTNDLVKVAGTTSASASVQMSGCVCGTEGGRSSTWTEDHVGHSLPFLLLNFLELIKILDKSPEEVLAAVAYKELAYLKQFGRPLLPFQRERRESYGHKEQSPSDHIENLHRYLLIAPLLVPKNSALHNFRIRHPDLQPSKVIVSTSSDSNELKIVSLLDWQHASILPLFLLAGIPGRLQNYDDPVSQALVHPSLPANIDELDESEQSHAMQLYHRRLVHFHYVKNTEEYNKLHDDAMSDLVCMLIYRLCEQAGAPWEGETHALKSLLIEATEIWGRLTGKDVPCPIIFEPEDICKTKELGEKLQVADENFEGCQAIVGFGTDTWVSTEHYRMAMALAETLTTRIFTMVREIEEEVRAKAEANWFLSDMDEKDNM
ncbi:hypothetical protein C0989_002211 [Termitomyces sp. Mn162]|nr:hypothetical protein C0989_002211 [Termitomyces sp. Mn162]